MKNRLSNFHREQTERERVEISRRPLEYNYFHGSFNIIMCGKKRFPYTKKGAVAAIAHAKKTGEVPYPARLSGKGRKKDKKGK